MATSEKQDNSRKLSTEERSLVIHSIEYAHKGALRAVTSNSEPALKDFYQTRAYALQALANRFRTTELDLS